MNIIVDTFRKDRKMWGYTKLKYRGARRVMALFLVVLTFCMALPVETWGYAGEYISKLAEEIRPDSAIQSMVMKKGSETGEVVADLGNGETPEMVAGEEYYLCVQMKVPELQENQRNFVSIILGNKDGDAFDANGLVYTNVPGNPDVPGDIVHDGFSRLLERQECSDIQYGSDSTHDGTLNAYEMRDGSFTYEISANKLAGDIIYFAVGVKVDNTFWSNTESIQDAIHLQMGSINVDNQKTYSEKKAFDVKLSDEGRKKFTYTLSSYSMNVVLGQYSSPVNPYIASETQSQMLYKSITYDVTYPTGAEFRASMSNSSPEVLQSKVLGTISKGNKIDNGGQATVDLQAKVSGLIDALPFQDKLTFQMTDEAGRTISLDPVALGTDHVARATWNVTQAGSYDIGIKIANQTNLNYQLADIGVLHIYVVADQPIVYHTIHFDGNAADATLDTTQKTVVEGKIYGTLPTPQRAGYKFDGWYTDPDGTNQITAETVAGLGEVATEQTLYAHWTEKVYVVTYNTGTADTPAQKQITYQAAGLLPSEEITKTGYHLTGWALSGTEQAVTNETTYQSLVSDDTVTQVTLVAKWAPNSYVVTYDGNGGAISTANVRVLYDSNYGNLITPKRTGYRFDGWTDETGRVVRAGTLYQFDHNTTLTAMWSVKTDYAVSYNSNGGSSVASRTGVAWNAASLVPDEVPVREGYEFKGWKYGNVQVDQTMTYGALAVTENTYSVTLIADWQPEQYHVSFDVNDPWNSHADSVPDTITVYTGRTYAALPVTTCRGYQFDGWYTQPEGGTKVVNGSSVTILEDHTLYAHWNVERYQITLPDSTVGYSLVPLESTSVEFGKDFSFQLNIEEGYQKTADFAVKVRKNSEPDSAAVAIAEQDGTYTISQVQDDLTVLISGIDDQTGPSVVISIADKSWDDMAADTEIYFGQDQTVTIEAMDAGSGLAEVYYYIADREMSSSEISDAAIVWKPYLLPFQIRDNSEQFIYAKAVDRRGNITYVNTDKVILDQINPVINGITDGATYTGTQRFTVVEQYFDSLSVNGVPTSSI